MELQRRPGRKLGVTNAEAASGHTPEYSSVRHKANELGISISELCIRAGVNFNTVQNWRTRFPRTVNAAEMLDRLKGVQS